MSRILVAEDNEANRELVREYLEAHGYEVVAACDGQEALEKAAALPPDLVLLDIQMPVLDGFATLRRFRGTKQYASLPIVAFTASAMQGDSARALAEGFDAYLTKPIDLKSLLAEVQRWLRRDAGSE